MYNKSEIKIDKESAINVNFPMLISPGSFIQGIESSFQTTLRNCSCNDLSLEAIQGMEEEVAQLGSIALRKLCDLGLRGNLKKLTTKK